jgi:hypothetical protein
MAYLAQTLITRSWFLSGIVARNLQTVTGDQINEGLMLLNSLLDFKQIETDLIPYWTYIELNLIPNQETYFLPYIAEIESSTFNIGVVRYPMDQISRRNYYGSARVDNLSSLPFSWNFNRGEGGGTFATYFLPESNYPWKMMVKFFLTDVALQTDLTNVYSGLAAGFVTNVNVTSPGVYTSLPTVTIGAPPLGGTQATGYPILTNGGISSIYLTNSGSGYITAPPVVISGGGGTGGGAATSVITSYNFLQNSNAGYDTSYIEYLRYALARQMASEYGILFNPQSEKIFQSYQRKLMYMSPPDLSQKKVTILASDNQTGFSYADVNIGMGWRPS